MARYSREDRVSLERYRRLYAETPQDRPLSETLARGAKTALGLTAGIVGLTYAVRSGAATKFITSASNFTGAISAGRKALFSNMPNTINQPTLGIALSSRLSNMRNAVINYSNKNNALGRSALERVASKLDTDELIAGLQSRVTMAHRMQMFVGNVSQVKLDEEQRQAIGRLVSSDRYKIWESGTSGGEGMKKPFFFDILLQQEESLKNAPDALKEEIYKAYANSKPMDASVLKSISESRAKQVQQEMQKVHLRRRGGLFNKYVDRFIGRAYTVDELIDDVVSGSSRVPTGLEQEFKYGSSEFNTLFDLRGKGYIVDPGMRVRGDTVLDLRRLAQAGSAFSKSLASNTLPGRILKGISPTGFLPGELGHPENLYKVTPFGSIQPYLEPSRQMTGFSKYARDDAILSIGDKAYNLIGGELVGENLMDLSRYGPLGREARRLAGMSARYRAGDKHGLLGLLDIGMQEGASAIDRFRYAIDRQKDPEWIRNVIKGAVDPANKQKLTFNDLLDISDFMRSRTEAPDSRVIKILAEHMANNLNAQGQAAPIGISQLVKDFDLDTIDGLRAAFKSLQASGQIENNSGLLFLANRMREDPEAFLSNVVAPVARPNNFVPTKLLTGADILRREIAATLINPDIGIMGAPTQLNSIAHLLNNKQISTDDAKILNRLYTYKFISERTQQAIMASDVTTRDKIVENMEDLFRKHGQNVLTTSMGGTAAEYMPKFGALNRRPEEILMSQSSMLISRSGPSSSAARAQLRQANLFQRAKAFGTEMLAGRDNIQDASLRTLYGMHYFTRISDLMSNVGLGLSDKSMSSIPNTITSLFLKRYLAAGVGMAALGYASFEVGNLTGASLNQRAWGAARNISQGVRGFADVTGLSKTYANMYNVFAPFQALDENGPMTREEYDEWLRTGESPVRYGRFWTLGPQPFKGSRVMYYRPNAFRMGQSEYKMASSLYGSPQEYWANHWLPTPRYPLAPLRHFITDRYHWENKHRKDRPYPYSAPMFSDSSMFGQIGNATIGQVMKPTRSMLSEDQMRQSVKSYQEALSTINRGIRDGGGVPLSAGGGAYGGGKGVGGYYSGGAGTGGTDSAVYSFVVHPDGQIRMAKDEARQEAENITIERMQQLGKKFKFNQYQMTMINQGIINKANSRDRFEKQYGASGNAPYDLMATRRMDALYELNMIDELLTEGPDGPDVTYNARRALGIYGLAAESILGLARERRVNWANAGRMTSSARAFYDLNLGGLGGPGMRAIRRMMPRGPWSYEFNPIRNTMPEWMPFEFRYGDPYQRVPEGEARLPGGSYERLHKLHPDALAGAEEGQWDKYGAFDRFRILADVAPYSDEYRYWKDYVEANITDPELKKRITTIKKQVSKVRRRYELHPYRFTGSEIDRISATVSRVVDPNTVLTDEYGLVRLAGVRASAESGGLQNYLKPGMTITLGVNPDETLRRNQDTYKTMSAAIYWNNKNLGLEMLEQGAAKERESDYSPAGVHSRFKPQQFALGQLSELLGHLDTPITNKFIPMRTALEYQKRRRIYGRETAWLMNPWSDYLKPTIQAIARKDPVQASFAGGMIGAFIGGTLGLGRWKEGWAIGSRVGPALALGRRAIEAATGEYWMPAQWKKVGVIEEYFDALEYMKYTRLYEAAARRAGRNRLSRKLNELERFKAQRENALDELSRKKRSLYKYNKSDSPQMAEINEAINALKVAGRESPVKLGYWDTIALAYRARARSTIMGQDSDSTWQEMLAALPPADRELFAEFMKAPKSQHADILKHVHPYQRDMLKKVWARRERGTAIGKLADRFSDMSTKDKEQALYDYFSKKGMPLPDKGWEGWKHDVSIKHIKLRVMRNAKVDVQQAGYSRRDYEEARYIRREHIPDIRRARDQGGLSLNMKIRQSLSGKGFKDVDIVAMQNFSFSPLNAVVNIVSNVGYASSALVDAVKQDLKI